MNYKTITQDEKDEILTGTLMSQERDLYIHNINKERYESMLQNLPAGEFKARIERLLAETNMRIVEINSILAALTPQLPSDEKINQAVSRIQDKENQIVSQK